MKKMEQFKFYLDSYQIINVKLKVLEEKQNLKPLKTLIVSQLHTVMIATQLKVSLRAILMVLRELSNALVTMQSVGTKITNYMAMPSFIILKTN